MVAGDWLAVFSQPLMVLGQYVAALLMYCWRQPRRDGFSLRIGAVIAASLAFTLTASYVGFVVEPRLMGEWSFVTQIVLFCLLPLVLVALILVCYDVSLWTAVFLSVAGFATQNVASGLLGVFYVIAGGIGVVHDVESDIIAVYPVVVDWLNLLMGLAFTAASYLACYHLFAKTLTRTWESTSEDSHAAVTFVVVALVETVFDMSMKSTYNYGLPVFQRAMFGVTKILICFFLLFAEFRLLYVGRLERDVAISERLLRERARQFHVSQANIEAINLKCHDIRHQIRHLGDGGRVVSADALNDIAREVSIYDSQVRTGNEALDTILTEKGLACTRAGIAFSCMADGELLSAIPDAEIYSLFGNILDNAIEAVRNVGSGEKRRISLVVRRRGDMVSVHEENFYSGRLVFRDGLPQTTKAQPSEHGFGTQSIRAVTERHGGTLSMRVEGEQFLLDILLPEG